MKITSLLYHDVIENGNFRESGFNGSGPDSYKLDLPDFKSHLEVSAPKLSGQAARFNEFVKAGRVDAEVLRLITFDDGGVSFLTRIAPLLENYQATGLFFIATGFLDTDGFLTKAQVKELHNRGHIIGSHSHSHPKIISNLSYKELLTEWKTSKDMLGDIVGEEILTASVPGGFYSGQVAQSAEEAGFKVLFTSEPTNKVEMVGRCYVAGRYSIKQNDPPSKAAKIVNHDLFFFAKEFLYWNLKKLLKNSLGNNYLKLREKLLR